MNYFNNYFQSNFNKDILRDILKKIRVLVITKNNFIKWKFN